jgi:Tol biopolymer transport system component
MNARRNVDLDRVIGRWLEEAAEPIWVGYLDDVLEQTSRRRQRPAWTFPGRWLPLDLVHGSRLAPATIPLLLVLAALLALVMWALGVGSHQQLPPFGLARPGLIALDVDRHITVMADDGGTRVLTSGPETDTSPTWSPDGELLAFWRATGDGHWTIVVMDAGGRLRSSLGVEATTPLPYPSDDPRWSTLGWALGAPGVFAWSPDSTRLAFSQVVEGMSGIWVIGADGSGLRQLGDPTLQARDPAWSSDGTRIVFHGGAEGPGGGDGMWVMDADGRGARRISRVGGGGDSFDYPKWQPGGQLIAFVALPNGKAHVFVVRSDGTAERDLSASTEDPSADDWLPTWSPDGSQVAWIRFATAWPNGQIVVADADGTRTSMPAMEPTGGIGLPTWSPDGRAIGVFVGDAAGVPVAWMSVRLDGTVPPTVVPVANNSGGASWQRLPP